MPVPREAIPAALPAIALSCLFLNAAEPLDRDGQAAGDALSAENLDLLLQLQTANPIHWSGWFRPPLTGQAVHPRPLQTPVWVGVGGHARVVVRAGWLGLALMIGCEFARFGRLWICAAAAVSGMPAAGIW